MAIYSQDQIRNALMQISTGVRPPIGGAPTRLGMPSSAAGALPNLSKMLGPYDPNAKPAPEEERSLEKARLNATQRILSDPNVSESDKQQLIKNLEKIAQGKKPSGGFSIGNFLKGTLGKAAEAGMYVMSRPLAIVTSAGKELSDIPSGKASLGDFFKQAVAKDTTPSKYLPKTGTKWLDATIGLIADVALDPMTYINFGASQWAGREGRLNLAAFAAKEENLAKAPSLLAKVENGSIARLGEWALDATEREALGIRRGLRFAFGEGNVIGKEGTALGNISENVAQFFGGNFAKGRAVLGDSKLFTPLQKLTAKEGEKIAGLTMYGRRAADDANVIERLTNLAKYNSAIKSNSAGRLIGSRLGREGSSIVNDLMNHEASGSRIFEVLEGTRSAVDDAEAALAERTRSFFDSAANAVNEPTAEFGVKRGTSPFLIEKRENYVPHVFSDAAKEKLATKEFQNSSAASSLRRSLGIGRDELTVGPSALRERSLTTGKKFLGTELKSDIGGGYASLSEINAIAEKRLGFKLFEEDASKYVSHYISSAVNQAKRVAFVDSLFDYGPDVVRRIVPNIVDNKVVDAQFAKTLKSYDNIVTPILDELSTTTQGVLGPRLALAQAVLSSEPGAKILTERQLDGVRKVLQNTMDNLSAADNVVSKLDSETKAAYEAVSRPLRNRLNTINQSIATGDEIQLVKQLGLDDLYKRLYPGAVNVPEAKAAAEDIVDGLNHLLGDEYASPALKSLEDALTGAEQNVAGSATSAVNRLKSQLESMTATEPQATVKIAKTQKQLDFATSKMEAQDVVALGKDQWDSSVGSVYGNDINRIMEEIAANPPDGVIGQSTANWVERTTRTLQQLDAPGLALSAEEKTVMSNVFSQLKGMESQIALLEAQRAIPESVINGAFNKGSVMKAAQKTVKGWENIESLGVQMSPELRDQLFGKMGMLAKPEGAEEFMKMFKAYTKYFKVSAMLSPGFVARNGYTAAWNDFVHGVSLRDIYDGTKFSKNVMVHGIDKALSMVPEKARGLYEEALKAAYAGGAGQTVDDILGPIVSGRAKKLLQGKIVGTWAKANEGMELGARFSMALSDLRKGRSFESAVGNIVRYHFDYSNLSTLDKALTGSGVIPFWIFASRNMPLQIVNQIARPKMFRMYEAFQRNFAPTDQENVPEYLKQRGMVQLPFMPKGTLLNLDLPHLDMQDQLRMFADPMRLLSQANPLVKLPIELMGNRQLFTATPFPEKPAPVRGPLDYPAFIAGLLSGGAGRNPQTGQFYTTSKAQYAVPSALPTLAQLQRLIPWGGGKEIYQDRAGSSYAAFFGLPFRKVAEGEKFNELQRRQFAIRDYLSSLSRTGQITPKNQ